MGTWKVEFDKAAERDLDKLDPQVIRRIERFLYERVATLDNPRLIGEALHGSKLGEFWKYRVGDYRIVCKIEAQCSARFGGADWSSPRGVSAIIIALRGLSEAEAKIASAAETIKAH